MIKEIENDYEVLDKWVDWLTEYRQKHYSSSSLKIMGIGVSLDKLEFAATNLLPIIKSPSWSVTDNSWEGTTDGNYKSRLVSEWTGGIVHKCEPALGSFISSEPERNYFSIAWEAPSYHDDLRYAAHVFRLTIPQKKKFKNKNQNSDLY